MIRITFWFKWKVKLTTGKEKQELSETANILKFRDNPLMTLVSIKVIKKRNFNTKQK